MLLSSIELTQQANSLKYKQLLLLLLFQRAYNETIRN